VSLHLPYLKRFEQSFADPEANLSFDETLLSEVDADPSKSFFRVWESPSYFVVLGRSNQAEKECDVATCTQDHIPILKRASGGGTVLQGPGCLNYSAVFPIAAAAEFTSISGTSCAVLNDVRQRLSGLALDITIQGTSDLCVGPLKFSGNAQKRTRLSVLFHGTILYDFDLGLISKYLLHPSKEPAYRSGRGHDGFLMNLGIERQILVKSLTNFEKGSSFTVAGKPEPMNPVD